MDTENLQISCNRKVFNYAVLDNLDTQIFIQNRANEIRVLVKRSAQDVIEIGQKLIEVKYKLPHGAFGDWLEAEFGWTKMTATRFINVAENFKSNNLLHLDNFAPSALYLLSAPSTPDEARQDALEQAENGEEITHKKAKEIIDNHKFHCPDCNEVFNVKVWHCVYCDHHYHDNQLDCPNCHNEKLHGADKEEAKELKKVAPELIEFVKDRKKTLTWAKREYLKLSRETLPLPTGKYRVLYADPPWKYGNNMPDYFTEQADHYPLMTIKEIAAMPIEEIVEDSAVLFLWITSPILDECWEVVKAWGFKYKASFIWDKIKHNMGHYNSVRHEILLICTRGSCMPDVQKLYDSVQSIERTEHSTKPEEFRQIIDTIYPNGKRIELFARKRVENWDVYGNERILQAT